MGEVKEMIIAAPLEKIQVQEQARLSLQVVGDGIYK